MLPVTFSCANSTLGPPPGDTLTDCGSLPVQRTFEDGQPVFNSRWRMSDEERAHIAAGGDIELTIWGTGHPPVAVNVVDAEAPQEAPDEVGSTTDG